MQKPSSLSRRNFLRKTAVAASVPFILPSHIWCAQTKPNDRLVLGSIGVGTQGRGLLGGILRKSETQTVAICDVDKNRRENGRRIVQEHYAKQPGGTAAAGCEVYSDFRELLARKDIDAVIIATPDHWHALIAIAAARAGKDIYCEKPLSESIHEARAMVNAVRKNKRIFQTGSMQRSSKEFHHACELVRNGRLGKLQRVDVGVGGPAKPCDLPGEAEEPGLDWNMWLGPAPERPYNSILSPRGVHTHFPLWRNYREYGGGGVTDWGAHHFDIAQWGLGMDNSGPVEIIPASTPNAHNGVKLIYANGVEVTHTGGNGITFFGTEGKIYVNRGKFEATPASLDEAPIPAGGVHLYRSTDHQRDWLDSIRSRKPPICDVEIGARTVTVCHLVNLAYYHGQRMKWDPKKEKFTAGTGDKKWLDVPYRGPWKLA